MGTLFACTWLAEGSAYAGLYAILSGGAFLAAFFMATDYATSPVAPAGKVIMGVGCGLITFVIRRFSSMPEGVSYAVLFMKPDGAAGRPLRAAACVWGGEEACVRR